MVKLTQLELPESSAAVICFIPCRYEKKAILFFEGLFWFLKKRIPGISFCFPCFNAALFHPRNI